MKSVLDKAGVNHAEQYELDPAASKEGLQVMNQMYDKLPLFDITLQLMEQKGKLTGYKQTYVEVQSGETPRSRRSFRPIPLSKVSRIFT
ncbi:two-component system regulatory protein YycI [Paenibacillus sp. CC-CFT747]|nr:two-component system regulatory protein YycI [Paenibacillus sp. CC-CFT747]